MIDLVLLLWGGSFDLGPLTRVASHFEQSSSLPVRVHLATDKHRDAAPDSWLQHVLGSAPPNVRALHAQYDNRTHGPGSIYMWKPLLHLILPVELEKVVVLDGDILAAPRTDLADLWAEFDRFSESEVLGLAREQTPTYDSTVGVSHGLNGGVQLLHLGKMRASLAYERMLRDGAEGKLGDIGYLGDQTFYSAMHRASDGAALVHLLPCGWNRQLSDNQWHHPLFGRAHGCSEWPAG